MNKKLILFLFTLCFFGCNQREEFKASTGLLYFDVDGFFKQEVARLKKVNPEVVKEVSVNGTTEQSAIHIPNWEKELAIFSNADINKASWKGSFEIQKTENTESYTSNNKRIPVKKVLVYRYHSKVNKLEIIISNKNILYSSGDTLLYCPDSLYQIKKHQKIKLMKAKTYGVTGRFKQKKA